MSAPRFLCVLPILLAPLTSLMAQGETQRSPELQAPFMVRSGDHPIDVDTGHAAPFLADMNGDGLRDLLVGQFGRDETMGALRVYLNLGQKGQPKFEDFNYFQAGGATGKVPIG